MTVRKARREQLASEGRLACPDQLKYPLDTKKRIRNALSRYSQRRTTKCSGGLERICRVAKSAGIKSAKCKRRGL
jgi:hypothetical protein